MLSFSPSCSASSLPPSIWYVGSLAGKSIGFSRQIDNILTRSQTIVATAIPKITDEFGGLDKVSWYGSAFFMTNGGFQSSWGKAYKYFPLKVTFLLAIAVFEIGSLICALAPNSTVLIVGRAFNGLGASGLGTGAYTIIAFVAEPKKRPAFTGFVGISYGIAFVVGPLLGGVFAGKVSWRWCFYVNLPLGGASAVVILLFFRTPDGAKPVRASWKAKLLQMDPLGVIMVMGFLVAFIMALEFGGQSERWNSSTLISLLVSCATILTAFIFWEAFQSDRAMLAPRLLRHRPIGVSSIYTYFFSGSYYLVIYFLPIYFQSIHNASPIMSGVYILPLIIAITLSMILSGIFIGSTGLATPAKVVGTAIAIMGAGFLYTFDLDTSTGKWIGFQVVGGIGWGLAFQIPIIVSQSSVAAEDISSVTAIILCNTIEASLVRSHPHKTYACCSFYEHGRHLLYHSSAVRLRQQLDKQVTIYGPECRSRCCYRDWCNATPLGLPG